MKTVVLFTTLCVSLGQESGEPLSLDEAQQIAFENHPSLRVAAAKWEAAAARAGYAGTLPNPEGILRIESAPASRVSDGEYVAGVSQAAPIGGRLRAEKNVAEAELEVARSRQELAVWELRRRVHAAFAAALYAQEFSRFQMTLRTNAQRLAVILARRLELGDATPADVAVVRLEKIQAELDSRRADTLQAQAILALNNALGATNSANRPLAGSVQEILALPELEETLTNVPLLTSLSAGELAAAQARVRQIRRERIPDVNLDLLYRRIQAERESAFDVGVRVAIPVFSRNKERLREAAAQAAEAEARLEQKQKDAETRSGQDLLTLSTAVGSARLIRNEALPEAERLSSILERRFAAGDISLSELLEQRRQLATLQLAYLESVRGILESWSGMMED